MRIRAAVAVVAAGVIATPALAGDSHYDLLRVFRPEIARIKRNSSVPVLLPRYFAAPPKVKAYGSGGAMRKGWRLLLEADPRCREANACFLASFEARRGGTLPEKPNLRLSTGDPALYIPFSCGASCGPTSLWFRHGGVLYGWQSKLTSKRSELARLAAQAIRAGPR